MADIFLSYARADDSEHERVRPIAEALQAVGYSVFWDQNIPAGQDYFVYLERELDEARCVVVVWSSASKSSFWVKEEATTGRENNLLVPVSLDDSRPPLGFRSIQTISLREWDGTLEHESWKRLINSIDHYAPRRKNIGASRITSKSPWHVLLLLDDSGSMAGEIASKINDSIRALIAEMQVITAGRKPYFFLSIITYGSHAAVLFERKHADEIDADHEFVTGGSSGCNIADAFSLAKNLLQRNPGISQDFTPYVFLLSGGAPTCDLELALQSAQSVKNLDLPPGKPRVVTVSIGDECDAYFMQEAASTKFHVQLNDAGDLSRFFPRIGTISGTKSSEDEISEAIKNY